MSPIIADRLFSSLQFVSFSRLFQTNSIKPVSLQSPVSADRLISGLLGNAIFQCPNERLWKLYKQLSCLRAIKILNLCVMWPEIFIIALMQVKFIH